MSAVCFVHTDRAGTPCARCGTFGCEACLQGGRCASCEQALAVKAPTPADAVGFVLRVFSRLFDLATHAAMSVLGASIAVAVLAMLSQFGVTDQGWLQRLKLDLGLRAFVAISSTVISTGVMNQICGASLGKVLLRQRIVRVDGQRSRFIDGVLRELGFYVDLVFLLVGYNVTNASVLRQRVGDRWANTVVVRADAVSPRTRASPTELAVGVLVGLVLKAVLTAATLVLALR